MRARALAVADMAQRELVLLSQSLEPLLYDTPPFVDAVSRLARSGRHARARFLVRDPRPLIESGHRLLLLAQKLPSYIEIRRVAEANLHDTQGFLCNGRDALYQSRHDDFEAMYHHDDRRRAAELGEVFERLWEQAEQTPDLRRLPFTGS